MVIKLDLSYDAQDDLFLQLLYEGYELCYWCMKDYMQILKEHPDRTFYNEDIYTAMKTLEAYERLAEHYSAKDEHLKKLQDIRDRVDIKGKIAKGMSNE